MKKFILIGFICFFSGQWIWAQDYIPQISHRYYISDTACIKPRTPWRAAVEVFGLNMMVWGFDRYIVNEDWAHINGKTIRSNFKKGPVWDTDQFSTNLFSHPYHGSLYFNAARSNGMNFWQSIPFAAGGSLMWEFFMENEPPSINDMLATTFGGIELGEITYRLSDLFIDNRSSGAERVGREILAGLLSPVRGFNRLLSGEAWKYSSSKGRSYTSVPVNFIVTTGPRFLAEQDDSRHGTTSMNINFHLDYGNPFNDEFYSPYEWFRFNFGVDLFSAQPVISQVNAIGALWGKNIWKTERRTLTAGIFQHFDYYNSELRSNSEMKVAPYRISEAAAIGGGLIYHKSSPDEKTDIYAEAYLNGVALGASLSDYMLLGERDYNLGSGYSSKASAGIVYNKRLAFLLNLENYHIFTWKGYNPDTDWETIDTSTLNVQGDKGNARLTVFSIKLGYLLKDRWNIVLSNRYFSRRTNYKYYDAVDSSTYDVMLSLGIRI
ncbi:DUF3943 domain-containing protein [Parabacteroides sp. AM08-6]|uniref:DUF3943 domain-containing protein n=1 Tax=Parabacteroides sp. AM08-6 TaxID=2292053 RepID=UPI000EFFDF22|nr:DUF3943 domain-containing protein [Parabacteroides sp. AM08-6]RHJ83269.1 DUF3943 domain-containing protein [Parabacteroides sp. AM08-6]